jgi:hypothetical protein
MYRFPLFQSNDELLFSFPGPEEFSVPSFRGLALRPRPMGGIGFWQCAEKKTVDLPLWSVLGASLRCAACHGSVALLVSLLGLVTGVGVGRSRT